MKNLLKQILLICILSLTYSCQPEMAGENETDHKTELRNSACSCDEGDYMPEIINVVDNCAEMNG